MRIDVRGVHLKLSSPITRYVLDHLLHALDCHQSRVQSVNVRLCDESGRHKQNSHDKRCHLRIGIRGRSPVIIDARGGDLYATVDVAAQRAKRAVRQEINRRRDVRRHQHAMMTA